LIDLIVKVALSQIEVKNNESPERQYLYWSARKKGKSEILLISYSPGGFSANGL
jgi:hypothetical protein